MLACRRANTIPVVPAVQRLCVECGYAVWVSLTMAPRVDSGEYPPVCLECLPGVLARQPSVDGQIHPDQIPELRELGILEFTHNFLDTLNRAMQAERN